MDSYCELISLCREAGGTLSFIGKTALGYDIPMLSKGKSKKTLYIGGVHAREYITAYLLIELFKDFDGEVSVVPLLNIDGTILSRRGVSFLQERFVESADERIKFLLEVNGSSDFSLWKANLNAVDINVNFPARWGKGAQNVSHPSSESYIGPCPASEKETQCVINLLNEEFKAVIAYHSKGEEVYYGLGNNFSDRDFAEKVGKFLNYEVRTTPHSTGGIKDYVCERKLGKALTVEVAPDSLCHPIKINRLPELVSRHRGIMEFIDGLL